MRITVLGGGSWGTAISQELSKNYDIDLYVRNEKTIESINNDHKNDRYLSEYVLNPNIKASSDIESLLKNKYIINAIPTQAIRKMLEANHSYFNDDSVIINLSKGIEVTTNKRISEIFAEFLPKVKFASLSGPSHAEEVIKSVPTSLVCASLDHDLSCEIQDLLNSETLRIYTNDDLIGTEYGGAVKNVLAIGAGIIDGLDFGDNSKAAILTRGIHEMTRFCLAMGGQRNTLYGLAGLGDLMVTANSKHSRNRKAGELIGQGHTIESLENDIGMVVEGIPTAKALYHISREKNIYMPITNVIYKILYENMDFNKAIKDLMTKDTKPEFEI